MTRQKEQEDQAEKTREEIGKGNQMTALRFQTGARHQTSPASLGGLLVERSCSKYKHIITGNNYKLVFLQHTNSKKPQKSVSAIAKTTLGGRMGWMGLGG